MSGGIAYVLDMDNSFEQRVNPEMIGIEALQEEDEALVKAKMEKHVALTGSPLAAEYLNNWSEIVTRFRKVMPNDLKRVLESKKQAEKVA